MESRAKLQIVTAVWGRWHIDAFLNINLPTLLAPGNFPVLAKTCDIHYVIYTNRHDQAELKESTIISVLSLLMTVEIRLLEDHVLMDPIAAHHLAWERATDEAKKAGSFILMMPPDVAWADRSFGNVGHLLSEGYRAIFMTYLRAEENSFSATLGMERKSEDGSLSISSDRMVELCINCLHPLMAAYLADSEYFPIHPEMMIWAVPGEGLLVRVLAREMFLFDPREITLNKMRLPKDSVSPEDGYFIADSEELFGVSLAPIGKDAEWHLTPHHADPIEVGGWWSVYDSGVNDFIVSHHIRWHFAPTTESKWKAKERQSDLFIRRAAAVREGIRFWQIAHKLHLPKVAGLIAVAAQNGIMPRALVGRGKTVAVLLPTERAFDNLDVDHFNRLYTFEGSQKLSRLLRAHIIMLDDIDALEEDPILEWAKKGRSRVVAGRGEWSYSMSYKDEVFIEGFRLMPGLPVSVGNHKVYLIEGILNYY